MLGSADENRNYVGGDVTGGEEEERSGSRNGERLMLGCVGEPLHFLGCRFCNMYSAGLGNLSLCEARVGVQVVRLYVQ
jgi:hypothetical protein